MVYLLLLALVVADVVGLKESLETIRINSAGSFVDSHGRIRIFHGVNVVYKTFPWYPDADTFDPFDSLVAEDMENLELWGFNVVRLGVMWPGVEPSPGKINTTYMQQIANLARNLSQHGIYTLAELHQDLLSRHFCGEGIPEYYVEDLLADNTSVLSKVKPFPEPSAKPLPRDAAGYPKLSACLKDSFDHYYSSEQVGALFKHLYTAGTPLNDGFLRFWSTVARTFADSKDKAPHILGYELINEPSGVCLEADSPRCGSRPQPIYDNNVETNYLAPLYRAAASKIRSVDADRPIFYEARELPMVWSSPFPELPLGNDTQQGVAYHIYCQPKFYTIVDEIVCRAVQQVSYSEFFGLLKRRKQLGAFLSEFGAIGQTAPEYAEIDRLLNAADDHMQSWSYWQLKKFHDLTTVNAEESLYDGDGKLESGKLKLLSRTYAQAIAGKPAHMSFRSADGDFELAYNASITSAPTEIYLNEAIHYSEGYRVEIEPSECVRQERHTNRILFHLLQSCLGAMVNIRIQAKASTELLF